MPARQAGFNGALQESLYTEKNISQNKHNINSEIARTREACYLTREDWQHYAILNARVLLDAAPPEVMNELAGRPSNFAPQAILLCEIFFMLFLKAEDRSRATGLSIDPEELWRQALLLREGAA